MSIFPTHYRMQKLEQDVTKIFTLVIFLQGTGCPKSHDPILKLYISKNLVRDDKFTTNL